MLPDPLENPIAFLTDHPVLTADVEAALIATMRAGVEAREAIRRDLPSSDPAMLRQVVLGDEARATLVRHNLRLVVSIAKRYLRVAGPHLTLEDLVSFGSVGLLHGIDRFDPRKSGKLSTYVTWWIRQAIGRSIAEEGRVIDLPVHVHERLGQQRRARSRLAQQLGREPAPEEIAADLGWRPQQVAHLDMVSQDVGSLNRRVHDANDRTELGDLLPDTRFDPEASALESSLRGDLAAVMARLLTAREQRFLRAYFGFDTGQPATLEAVGETEGLTRERVRQVIAGAISKLRDDPLIRAYRTPLERTGSREEHPR